MVPLFKKPVCSPPLRTLTDQGVIKEESAHFAGRGGRYVYIGKPLKKAISTTQFSTRYWTSIPICFNRSYKASSTRSSHNNIYCRRTFLFRKTLTEAILRILTLAVWSPLFQPLQAKILGPDSGYAKAPRATRQYLPATPFASPATKVNKSSEVDTNIKESSGVDCMLADTSRPAELQVSRNSLRNLVQLRRGTKLQPGVTLRSWQQRGLVLRSWHQRGVAQYPFCKQTAFLCPPTWCPVRALTQRIRGHAVLFLQATCLPADWKVHSLFSVAQQLEPSLLRSQDRFRRHDSATVKFKIERLVNN